VSRVHIKMTLARQINRFRTVTQYLKAAGVLTTLQLGRQRLRKALDLPVLQSIQVRPAGVRYPLTMRTEPSSDGAVFWEVFLRKVYACVADLPAPKLILDLGANVGYSSVYFLNRFPAARVVAVEPDPETGALCCRNLAPYGSRARVVPGAAWPEKAPLVLSRGSFGDGREWATQVRERAAGEHGYRVQGWDVASLIGMAGAQRVDLLKVDIERSELELFGRNVHTWLPRVDNLCIELHGSDCREAFFRALDGYEYDLENSSHLTVCRDLRLKACPVPVNQDAGPDLACGAGPTPPEGSICL
jgi:FkbM family methyltransferase